MSFAAAAAISGTTPGRSDASDAGGSASRCSRSSPTVQPAILR